MSQFLTSAVSPRCTNLCVCACACACAVRVFVCYVCGLCRYLCDHSRDNHGGLWRTAERERERERRDTPKETREEEREDKKKENIMNNV